MSILRRRSTLPAVAPPLEDDDLLSEILLRLPPQPSSLPRASAVCKHWRSIASDPGFSLRFRRHHRRNPPLLGFFNSYYGLTFQPTLDPPNRVSPGCFSLQRDDDDDRFITLGCRHGLVLMLDPKWKQVRVWDPVTGDQHRIALPPRLDAEGTLTNGAVLRAAAGDVHHFQVVVIVAGNDDELPQRVCACVYSSETRVWSDLISTALPPKDYIGFFRTNVLSYMPAVLVADSLYWTLVENYYAGILEFDLKRQSLAVIQLPRYMSPKYNELTVMRAEGGGLGFLFVSEVSLQAQLWKRKTDCDGVGSWVQRRTIKLDKLLSLDSKKEEWPGPVRIRWFAEDNNVVLLSAVTGLFMVQLESLQFKKLFTTHNFCLRHPFECVYAAGT